MIPEGTVLDGKYRLERRLGAGGMGAVHRASHLGTDRPVAVKLIAPRFAERPEFLERFRREARAAGRLRHPNVVDVTDFGLAEVGGDRVPYLVMELLDGRTLADALADDPLPPLDWISEVLEQTCTALDEAHRRGIVHRDLKPENLWLEPDRRGGFNVKVLDFGLAHLSGAEPVVVTPAPAAGPGALDDDAETLARVAPTPAGSQASTLTRVGDLLGTPAYMSPEQWRGEPLDARSDIYALGVIAWRMLAGHAPFTGPTIESVRDGHLSGRVPALPDRVPASLRALVAEAMDGDPARRPASAAAFAAAFRARSQSRADFFRDVVSLAASRWTQLLRVSLAAFALPLVVLLGSLAAGLATPGPTAPWWWRVPFVLLLLTVTVAIGGLGVLAEGLLLHALVVPRKVVRLRDLMSAFLPRARAYSRVMAPYYLGIGVPLILVPLSRMGGKPARLAGALVAVGFVIWMLRSIDRLWFAAQVVMSEGLEGRAAGDRSQELTRHMRKHLTGPENVANGLMAVCGFVASFFGAFTAMLLLRRVLADHVVVAWSLGGLVGLAVAALLMPLGSIAFGLLYFRTREASGEPLPGILAGFEEKLGVPPSVRLSPSASTPTPVHTAGR